MDSRHLIEPSLKLSVLHIGHCQTNRIGWELVSLWISEKPLFLFRHNFKLGKQKLPDWTFLRKAKLYYY